jgi:hypothetical protein
MIKNIEVLDRAETDTDNTVCLTDRQKGNLYNLNIMAKSIEEEIISKSQFTTFCHETDTGFMRELKEMGYIDFKETKDEIRNFKMLESGIDVAENYLGN